MKEVYYMCMFFFVLSNMIHPVYAQKSISDVTGVMLTEGKNKNNDISTARNYLLNGDLKNAIYTYSCLIHNEKINGRSSGRGVSGELMAEYAYALALNHDFDLALLNIDRARELGTDSKNYFVCQILNVMGFEDAAYQFVHRKEIAPAWILGSVNSMNQKYASKYLPEISDPKAALKLADRLVAGGQYIQAIVLYEALKSTYPNAYIVCVGYSTLWERMGNYEYAATLLKEGIALMEKVGEETDSEQKQVYKDHLLRLIAVYPSNQIREFDMGMKGTIYAGGTIVKDNYSMNFRMGVYTKKKWSCSMNVGLGYGNNNFNFNMGLSVYKIYNIFMMGLGMGWTESISFKKGVDDLSTFNFTPSIGLTFLNKAQTSSFDIMLGCNIPVTKHSQWGYNISIGQTFYFNLNKAKK